MVKGEMVKLASEVHMNLLFDCSLFSFIARMTAQNVVMRTGTRF